MRVLFSSTAGAGHFGPLVPFIRACLTAGHEALVAAPAALEPAVTPTGAGFWAFGDPDPADMQAVWSRLPTLSHAEADRMVCAEVFARLDATAAVPRLLDAIDEWRPDLVVRESAEFGSLVAAEVRGVPTRPVAIGLGEMEEYFLATATPNVDALRRSYGLPSDPSVLVRSDWFTLFPAGLEAVPLRGRRFRDPAWVRSSGDGDPFVYATFGSVAGSLPQLRHVYGAALEALADVDAEVLMTVGNDTDLASLGTPPPNVRVERWVDQNSVLARASAVVCHGGGGTTLAAVAAGVPLVVVPLFAGDQFINADRVAAVGAGLRVEAPEIRSAVDRVLDDGSFGAVARSLADEIAAHADPVEAFA